MMSKKNVSTPENAVPDELRKKLAVACRILGTEGHDDLNLGHLSARMPDRRDVMIMKGRGLCLSEIHEEDFVTLDFSYKKLGGKRDAHGEIPIHMEIYRRREDVNCVVHTHPLYATAFSATNQVLRPVNNEGSLFASPLPSFDLVTDLIVTPELGEALAEKLGDEKAVFLKNHGIVVVGESIEKATITAYLLEKTIKTLFIAKVLGEPTWTENSEAQQKGARIFTGPKTKAMWDTLVRQLEYREKPMRILEAIEKHVLNKSS